MTQTYTTVRNTFKTQPSPDIDKTVGSDPADLDNNFLHIDIL